MSDGNFRQELVDARREAERLRLSLRELRHRCLNEWQMFAAFAENETASYGEWIPRERLARLQTYVRMVAETHRLLTDGSGSHDCSYDRSVSLKSLLDALLWVLRARDGGAELSFDVEECLMLPRQCHALALIGSELVCNAAKHGASRVVVTFRVCGNRGRLQVSDDGPGFPEGFDPQVSAHTGLEVVDALCRHDLNGATLYGNGKRGAQVMVSFPLT